MRVNRAWLSLGKKAIESARSMGKVTRHWHIPTQLTVDKSGKKMINVTKPEHYPIQALFHELGHAMDPKSGLRSTRLQDEAVANAFARKLIKQYGGTDKHILQYNKSKAIREGYESYKPHVAREFSNAVEKRVRSNPHLTANMTKNELTPTSSAIKSKYKQLLSKKASRMTKAEAIMEKIALSSELLERAAKAALEKGQKTRSTKFLAASTKRLNQELDALYGAAKVVRDRGSKIGRHGNHSNSGIGDWKSNRAYK